MGWVAVTTVMAVDLPLSLLFRGRMTLQERVKGQTEVK